MFPMPERGVSLYLIGASDVRDLGAIFAYSFTQDGQFKTVEQIHQCLRDNQNPVFDTNLTHKIGDLEFHFSIDRYLPEHGNLHVRFKDMIVFYYDEADINSLIAARNLVETLKDLLFDKKVFFMGLRERNKEKTPYCKGAEEFARAKEISFLGSFSCQDLLLVREDLCYNLQDIFIQKYSNAHRKNPEECLRVLDPYLQEPSSQSSSASTAPNSALFRSGGDTQSQPSQPSQSSYTSSYGDSSSPSFEY